MEEPLFDHNLLIEMAWYKMPFGAHKGKFLSEVPESYYIWFRRQGFPTGKLGNYMQTVFDMKVNGIEGMLREIRRNTVNDRPVF
ncbi:hypothetical protein CW736_06815 [Nonlabens sp. MB-3u-79]|jgi:uncharacterized protein (DUF3820 family)|uniref:DUF3820 family protein n=2 Tax=Nonlabens TaxID=363408 RepID=UPI000C3043F7|nr:DUF3820 family protein [Nonlabens sp. MB-3u-79]AUC79110.1 hypothetical protein CW736_06815 [Nonlabens sp. MB-3u-79]|tara:strand:- start:1 stop:252 length:252 start_codon:yes stop_codon:yes gene_type:complete